MIGKILSAAAQASAAGAESTNISKMPGIPLPGSFFGKAARAFWREIRRRLPTRLGAFAFRETHSYREVRGGVRANTAAQTAEAPACLSILAISPAVAPVVSTSSTRSTRAP